MTIAKIKSNSTSSVIPTAWAPAAGSAAASVSATTHFTMPPGVVLSTSGHTLPTPGSSTAMDWMTTVFSHTPAVASNGSAPSTTTTTHSFTGSATTTHPATPITLVGTHAPTHTTTGVNGNHGSSS